MRLSTKQEKTIRLLECSNKTQILYGGSAGCFVGDTLVLTAKGHKPIKDIEIGELVYSLNEFKKGFIYRPTA